MDFQQFAATPHDTRWYPKVLAVSADSFEGLSVALDVWVQTGKLMNRGQGNWRLALSGTDDGALHTLVRKVQANFTKQKLTSFPDVLLSERQKGKLAVLFPGQGSQYPGMLQSLRTVWPSFDRHFSALEAAWSGRFGSRILDWIAVADDAQARTTLQDTRRAQLALGLTERALSLAWQEAGLKPDYLAGHSYGELPALAMAGAMDDAALYEITRMRGELLGEAGEQAPGGMLAVKSDRDTIAALIAPFADHVFLANDNAPLQTVVAGTHAGMVELAAVLQAAGITSTPLRTSAAFHSPLLAPVAARWNAFLESQIDMLRPIPAGLVYSNVNAAPYSGASAETAKLLGAQITSPVRWRDEIEALYAAGCRVFIEVGPSQVLTELTSRILGDRPHCRVASDPGKQGAADYLARLFAQLWVWGVELDLTLFAPSAAPATTGTSQSQSQSQSLPAAAQTRMSARLASPAEEAFFLANQQAVQDFFRHQQQIVAALGESTDTALFGQMVQANQSVMQDFLATQQAALRLDTGSVPTIMPALAQAKPVHVNAMSLKVGTGNAPTNAPASMNSQKIDIARWIIQELAELTGLPADRIHRHTQFESELGMDSITLVELWVQLAEVAPELRQHAGQVTGVSCVNDILALLADNPDNLPVNGVAEDNDIETWLLAEVAKLTGLPVDRLHPNTQFEAELGIDSITMVELWIRLVEKFPQFGEHSDGASRVQCVADVVALIDAGNANAPQAQVENAKSGTAMAAPVVATILPSSGAQTHAPLARPAYEWLTRLRANLVKRIAEECGIEPASITGSSHFAHDLGLNIFARERILEEEICRNPTLAFVGRELLNVANLDELSGLLMRFNESMSYPAVGIDEHGNAMAGDAEAEHIERYTQVGQPPIPASELGSIPDRILLVGEEGEIHAGLSAGFTSCGTAVESLYIGANGWRHPASGKSAGLDDIDGIAAILGVVATDGTLPAIIYLGLSAQDPLASSAMADCWRDQIERAGTGLFALAKAASPMVRSMDKKASIGVLIQNDSPAWAAAVGVAKSLALEWPKARVRTVRLLDDIAAMAPEMLLKVLTWGPTAHDIQLVNDGVIRQVLVKHPINQGMVQVRRRHSRLNEDSVILAVGGAAGITAEASVMLARQYHAHIVATGRTPMPDEYPYPGMADDAALKRSLFEECGPIDLGQATVQVSQKFASIRRQREIWTSRERILQAGGKFSYYQVDVTDTAALDETLARIRAECGPMHGLIHGAGMIDDCLLEKKTVDEFRQVYYTKAISIFNLYQALKNDPLEFVFLFSSLASYSGTPGQTDYVAANELINDFAKYWNKRVSYPVRTLLWSVWSETGLVASSATQRQMARLGLGGISNEQGIKLLHDELVGGNKFDEWVLLTPQSTLDYTVGGSVAAPRLQELAA